MGSLIPPIVYLKAIFHPYNHIYLHQLFHKTRKALFTPRIMLGGFSQLFIRQENPSGIVYTKDLYQGYNKTPLQLFTPRITKKIVHIIIFIFITSFIKQEKPSEVVYTKDYACRLFSTCCKVANIRLAGQNFVSWRNLF